VNITPPLPHVIVEALPAATWKDAGTQPADWFTVMASTTPGGLDATCSVIVPGSGVGVGVEVGGTGVCVGVGGNRGGRRRRSLVLVRRATQNKKAEDG
jgi:hypothetical protein